MLDAIASLPGGGIQQKMQNIKILIFFGPQKSRKVSTKRQIISTEAPAQGYGPKNFFSATFAKTYMSGLLLGD